MSRALGENAALGATKQQSGHKGSTQQRSRERSLRQRAAAAARHPAGAAALTAAASWALARGLAAAFQHTRRRFLRQLLIDLCAALDAIGQPYWMDFGALLGVHRWGGCFGRAAASAGPLHPHFAHARQTLRARGCSASKPLETAHPLVLAKTGLPPLRPTPWQRGGDIILHDNDVDLAVLNPDW